MFRTRMLRLAWKEYRSLRPAWLGLFALAAGLILLVMAIYPADDILIKNIASTMPAVLALALGAFLFTQEREDRTDEFFVYRRLPFWEPLAVKLTVGLVSVLSLRLVLEGFSVLYYTCGMAYGFRTKAYDWEVFRIPSNLITGEMLAWGLLFGLLFRSGVQAVFAAVLAWWGTVALLNSQDSLRWAMWQPSEAAEQLVEGRRAAAASMVLLAAIALGFRWPKEAPFGFAWLRLFLERKSNAASVSMRPSRRTSPAARAFVSLWWQTWRQAWPTAACLVAVQGMVLIYCSKGGASPTRPLSITTVVGIAFCGASVFRAERRNAGYRFLAERGVSPTIVWLVKQALWASVAAAVCLALLAHALHAPYIVPGAGAIASQVNSAVLSGMSVADALQYWRINEDFESVSAFFAVGLAIFAVGQWLSFSIPNPIVAAFFAIVAAGALILGMEYSFSLALPTTATISAIAIVFWASTLAGMKNWLLERGGWARAGWSASRIVAPLTFVLVADLCYRAFEVPLAPALSQQARLRSGANTEKALAPAASFVLPELSPFAETPGGHSAETMTYARKGWTKATKYEKAFLVANQRAIVQFNKIVAANQAAQVWMSGALGGSLYDDVPFSPVRPSPRVMNSFVWDTLKMLPLMEARRLEDAGDLKSAWKQYQASLSLARQIRGLNTTAAYFYAFDYERTVLEYLAAWALHPRQESPLLAEARRQIAVLTPLQLPIEAAERAAQLSWVERVEHQWKTERFDLKRPESFAFVVERLCPWERERSRRLIAWIHWDQEYKLAQFLTALKEGRPPSLPNAMARPIGNFWQFSVLDRWLTSATNGVQSTPTPRLLCGAVLNLETRRRATILLLAVVEQVRVDGTYPANLADLADVDPLALVNPITGRPFEYWPKGVGAPVELRLDDQSQTLAAGTAFLLWEVDGRQRIGTQLSAKALQETSPREWAESIRGISVQGFVLPPLAKKP